MNWHATLGAMIGGFLIWPVFLGSSMWFPAEVLMTADGNRTVGYVLESDGGSWTVLTERTRQVVRIPADDVQARTICNTQSNRKPLVTYLDGERSARRDNPKCPESQ